ncbi:MAG TPA: RES family NAD+ phosphorylase [Novosphingobium sp.]
MTPVLSAAPQPTYWLVPSRFPPIGLFDTVATAADANAVMELAGWTNDRLVAERIARLPSEQWVYGSPNSSIVMAAFLHVAPGGMRFNGPDLGAWYASAEMATAVAEVGHHLRREAAARRVPAMRRIYRNYAAALQGDYVDIRGQADALAGVLAPDNYTASQAFTPSLQREGHSGILYDSVRRRGGTNLAVWKPVNVADVVQAEHFEISVRAEERHIEVRRLTA